MVVAECLCGVLANTSITLSDGAVASYTVSIGASSLFINGKSVDDIFKRADAASYMAKDSGRNQVLCNSSSNCSTGLRQMNIIVYECQLAAMWESYHGKIVDGRDGSKAALMRS
ncbi:hypothetical protein GCM10022212_13790 [Actimicrobium antarcticum]|uniref:GGDEF domain-containing protein n=1 Tax=Actimicrobium antarcticum TaxID=1051899 RepID=A0ABP7T041_9BURK